MKTSAIEKAALRRLVAETGSRAAAARALGIGRSTVTEVLAGTRRLGPPALRRLGLRRVVDERVERVA